MTNNDDVIRVDKTPFDDVPVGQRRKTAKKWAKDQYRENNIFENDSTKQKIKITSGGIDHTVYEAYHPDAFYLLPVLPDIIRQAKFVSTEAPIRDADGRNPEPDLHQVERYRTNVQLRGKPFEVELIVKVKKGKKGGDRELDSIGMYRNYYHHELHGK